MTNYREVLRLHSLGLNKTGLAVSLHCARNTVTATLQRAENCSLQWPLPAEMSYVHREMQKSGVTLCAGRSIPAMEASKLLATCSEPGGMQ